MFLKRLAVGLAVLSALTIGSPAFAAGVPGISQKVGMCDPSYPTHCAAPNVSGAIPITGTITTSLGAFNPTGNATLALTVASARVALPSADPTALIRNTGSVDAYIAFGTVAVTASTSSTLIPAGQAVAFNVGTATYVAGITGSSTSSLAISTGTGLPTMTGGGSGSGGGAITAASSSYAAGAFSAGAGVDGWDLTQGAKADAACATDNGACSVAALLKRGNQNLTTLNTTAGGAIPAGTAIIGKVGIDQTTDGTTNAVHLVAGTALAGKFGIDQTTPGTTNGTQDAATSATGAAVPAKAIYAGAVSSGNVTGLIQADASAAINVSTATTTQIVALASAKKIYVTSFDVIAGGTGNITFEYGTGASCGTGTTVLTGAYNLTAQAGIAKGNGLGAVLVVPASNALCVVTSAAVQMSGSVAYTQF